MTRRDLSRNALLQRRAHLLVLPGTDTRRAEKYGHGLASVQRFLEALLPGLTRDQVPFVQPGLNPHIDHLAGQQLHRRFVSTVVG